jgi:hypothetical protein
VTSYLLRLPVFRQSLTGNHSGNNNNQSRHTVCVYRSSQKFRWGGGSAHASRRSMTKEKNGKQSISDEKLLRQREVLERRRRGEKRRSQRLSTNPDNRPQSPQQTIYIICCWWVAFKQLLAAVGVVESPTLTRLKFAPFPGGRTLTSSLPQSPAKPPSNGHNYSARAVHRGG